MGWIIEIIDPNRRGFSRRLAVDGNGLPHVVYVDAAGHLIYTFKDADSWHPETLDASGPGCNCGRNKGDTWAHAR
jgi:hypothetical protein